jgi:predicted nucleotidyltransferase
MALSQHRLQPPNKGLTKSQLISILYHDIFDYPLNEYEMTRWKAGKRVKLVKKVNISKKNDQYYVKGRDCLVKVKKIRLKESLRKYKLAKKVEKVLRLFPTVQMVGVTGSLAMSNASKQSDIDLMVVVTSGYLWLTRLLVLLTLKFLGIPLRKAKETDEQDKICLNMWMDERNLEIYNKNIFTAHELAQIIPLVNKNSTYESLLVINKWILDYWPKAVVLIPKVNLRNPKSKSKPSSLIEVIVYKFQHYYMKDKITNETVTLNRAFFHPRDWSIEVVNKLNKLGVIEI